MGRVMAWPSSTRMAAACGRSTSARPVHLPSWLPPDGGEIVFRGEQLSDDAPPPGIFAVRPDGSGLREISTRPAVDANDYEDISVSPDGTRIGYRGDDGPGGLFRSHVLDLRTGADRVLPSPDGAGQFGPVFSPDGQSVLYLRGLAGNRVQLVVAPADGSSTGKAIGPRRRLGADGPTINGYVLLARRQGRDRQLRRREAGSPPPDRRVARIRPRSMASWPSRPTSASHPDLRARRTYARRRRRRPSTARSTAAPSHPSAPARMPGMAHRVTLIPGDGIGPELAEATRRVLDASGVAFEWEVQDAGEAVMAEYGTPLPGARPRVDPAQQGRAQGPDHDARSATGFRSVNVTLRQVARPVRQPAARPAPSRASRRATRTSTS